ncbi:MAG: hypothetical protein A3C85_03860 [Candidatus Doudnabacteria bacterium RIFCSPHIGHO2_02_FULL_48_21]|uniref:Glycosyltransferase subfamily 4-like N-terminal domain-containing protein n=1 Tax=Candidatus Doudnabacteria bacterium RIFCSPLOWO2_02_FULL_48_13 TaxID=1817845 RepID=A0A1F5QBY7_9BACT|nr:MAG: hypothetical protein A3K05_03355 [Candidatus Doudnabacteria bacterium RIFCSPHIGHO2_01_48_18]OGE77173.1 MAG: hypothetical protein A2668_01675 [Candidatus Doudnabacteria bacterium RIFCSPHIGHO2_01_FULL_48_180]OGE91778.1 MAG: hypothetical protein A3F44_00200 [Candidatus Doudnabacteria bacterium RIFCSPHIGHO2_12_FULL_47_25]OGE93591.1 MAG: hypothetical protein A3C85_03860 [Candidatus Doudnabacteria bacterium RIFCSPHIGHO2_02_FULL_48_21]OGE96511.1 MAG: hypothetical protein A3A83_04260 [Candidatu
MSKILIATGIFPPDVGGPATYSRALSGELAKRGHSVDVVTYADKDKNLPQTDFPVTRIIRSRFKPWHYWKFYRAVVRLGANTDLIYAQGQVSEGYPAFMAARYLKKPLAVKITGDYSWERAVNSGYTDVLIDEFQNLKDYPPAIKRMRKVQEAVCRHAALIITPSEYLKKIVIGWGIKPEKIKVIYNAVEMPEMKLSKDEAREKLEIDKHTFLIVSSGRNVPWKGFALLEEAVQELQITRPEISLKILHNSPRQQLHEYIRAADAYVLNTGYEGLSNTLVEVLRLGTPIITTRVCGNPEIISDGVNGLLVDYNSKEQLTSAILDLKNDPALRQKFIDNSVPGARFQFDYMINETEKVLCAF